MTIARITASEIRAHQHANLRAAVDDVLRAMALDRPLEQVEGAMLEQPQAPAPVIHRFGPGLYIRELAMPAGTIAIGHRQRAEHMNVLLKGRVVMLNENGTTSEIAAPAIFVGKPGRKIGYVLEDMVWQNIYATSETDIDTLEATYLEKSNGWSRALPAPRAEDRADYFAMLDELGIPHELARAQAENEADQVAFPHGTYKCKVGASSIEGRGIVATADIEPGEVIAPARIGDKRTPAGRFTNHSRQPNAAMLRVIGGDIALVATRPIRGCAGGQDGEEITIDYRQALSLSCTEG